MLQFLALWVVLGSLAVLCAHQVWRTRSVRFCVLNCGGTGTAAALRAPVEVRATPRLHLSQTVALPTSGLVLQLGHTIVQPSSPTSRSSLPLLPQECLLPLAVPSLVRCVTSRWPLRCPLGRSRPLHSRFQSSRSFLSRHRLGLSRLRLEPRLGSSSLCLRPPSVPLTRTVPTRVGSSSPQGESGVGSASAAIPVAASQPLSMSRVVTSFC